MAGDSSLIEHEFTAAPMGRIAKVFGEKFAAALGELKSNHWYGPIESAYGQHLVLINDRIDGRSPALAEAYDTVRREWESAQRQETNEKFYQSLLKRYAVTVEPPGPTTDIQKQKIAQR
jgi:parvulin-like peptidyl-prolyl isomerase